MLRPTGPYRLASIPHLASLRHRDYRHMWVANMLSGAAMWTFIVAAAWLVLEDSGSSGQVGIVTFASMLPFLLVSPIAGLIADRFDRRTLVLLTLILSAINVAVLAALSMADVVMMWHVVTLALVGGVFRATQEPSVQALIPNQVPREDLLNAITLNGVTRQGARFFGLLVAAPLLGLGFVGISGVLVLSAAFHGIAALEMAQVRTASSGDIRPQHSFIRSLVDGLVYIYTNRTIATFIILVALHCALVMSFEAILPVLSREKLGATDASTLGYLVMGFGAGALVGTLLMAGVRNERRKGQWVIWTGLVSGVTPIALAVSGNLPLAVLASAGMGASQGTFMALTNTYIQSVAPDGLRGRIASLYSLHAGGIMAFSNLGYGFIADVFSAAPVLIVTSIVFIVVMLVLSVGEPTLRQVYRTGQVAVA